MAVSAPSPIPRPRSGEKGGPFRVLFFLLPLLVPVLILAVWQAMNGRWLVRPSLLPAPLAIAGAFRDLSASGELWTDLGASLLRVFEGFALGSGLGVVLGLGMGLFPLLNRSLVLVTGLLRPIPTIAWVPALILWMGIDEASKVTVIAVGTFWPVLLNVGQGVRGTDPKLLEVARVLEKGKWTVLTRIILPSALPALFTGLRVGLGIAWASVVGAELIAATSGIGYLIMYAREVSQPDVMLAGVFTIGLTGLAMDHLIVWLERRILRWHPGTPEETV
jgi:sulfonate transport system permease protein